MEDDSDCYQIFEELEKELIEVEDQLAIRLRLIPPCRHALLELDVNNKLEEDEVVAYWHELHTIYMDWKNWLKRNK